MKMALGDSGETKSPSKALSWRSRCQVRLSDNTDANAVGSQMAPAASWAEASEKARYLLELFAVALPAEDTRRRKLIDAVLEDFDRLARES